LDRIAHSRGLHGQSPSPQSRAVNSIEKSLEFETTPVRLIVSSESRPYKLARNQPAYFSPLFSSEGIRHDGEAEIVAIRSVVRQNFFE
jgi:hypothetical protein